MISVALAGAGQVGMSLLEILDHRTTNLEFVVTKNQRMPDQIPQKFKDSTVWLTSLKEISNNSSIKVVVEAIDDTETAKSFIIDCLRNGKTVISCSKDVWVKHLHEIVDSCKNFEDVGARLLLNSLAADSNGKSGYRDVFLDQDSIPNVDINDVIQFRGADGMATARVILADLEAAQMEGI